MFLIYVHYAKQVKIPTTYSAWHLSYDKCQLVMPVLAFHLWETSDAIIAQAVLFYSELFICLFCTSLTLDRYLRVNI